ncbi:DNA primase DnaG [Halopenitus persicus]|uniref:DNA primase DnaG n=1 Tax=Halopenitus persicus TaxID=1048396 RepID=UPI000BBADCAC|nr:DNA primase DnaG [Halopenitus persicus]
MEDTAKYLIHATIAADGVVERSDVVGAVFGQTEGLLGEELDLRDLQQSSKVGRIDVSIESENGQSFGEVTVASSLDKVETAILAAALETITRVGPCRASVEVTQIEDVRATKRREVVDRAKELLAGGFEETALSSDEVLEEVRDAARIEGIAEYEGLPAGPRVHDSDAVIVVEGRADVLTLLDAGIKNGVAVEGTNVPDAVAELSQDRTVTAFLDGDRGGELILRELAQVGDVDYVAFAPAGQSVEDLDRGAVLDALRGKVPYETLADEPNAREVARDPPSGSPTTESSTPADATDDPDEEPDSESTTTDDASTEATAAAETSTTRETAAPETAEAEAATANGSGEESSADADSAADAEAPADASTDTKSVRDHVSDVITADSGLARLLDDAGEVLSEVDAAAAFDAVEDAEPPPHTVVLDGEITQRLLDVAAQRGVSQVFGRSTGSMVKQPIGTRVTTVEDAAVEA